MNYTTQTIEIGNNCIVTIHRPILTKEERKKREQEVIEALEHFGKALEREKRK